MIEMFFVSLFLKVNFMSSMSSRQVDVWLAHILCLISGTLRLFHEYMFLDLRQSRITEITIGIGITAVRSFQGSPSLTGHFKSPPTSLGLVYLT